ncbi:MAG: hypothetical protein MUC40_07470 [Akkermansiaceae bacterium]|nr:hypothetical protein [Akkermansiaceae bacterium]
MMSEGASQVSRSWKTVSTIQAHSQAWPTLPKIHNTAAASGRPITAANNRPLARSMMKVAGVARLKPKRFSITKVS